MRVVRRTASVVPYKRVRPFFGLISGGVLAIIVVVEARFYPDDPEVIITAPAGRLECRRFTAYSLSLA